MNKETTNNENNLIIFDLVFGIVSLFLILFAFVNELSFERIMLIAIFSLIALRNMLKVIFK